MTKYVLKQIVVMKLCTVESGYNDTPGDQLEVPLYRYFDMPKPIPLTPGTVDSLACMDDTFTELDKKETTLPSSWCPLYSAKHVRLGRSKDEYNRSNVNKVDDQIKEAFSAYFSETKHTPFGGSLQANCSIDPKCLVYYYEVKINKLKSGAVISVGFGEEWSENYKEKGRSSKLPGELWNTFGWLSNGDLLCSGEKVGSMQGYGVNDIVVVAYRGWQVKEFLVVPKVGFRKNAEIRANFGQNHFEYHEKLKELIE
uniref:Uncharacterized protein n=1 Tax=Ditylenchus dipsaci TaxID=166011 RepID=A0A915DKN9_9BILA